MTKKILITAMVAIAFFSACDKVATESNEPILTVLAPTDNAVVAQGDTLFMNATYSDDTELTDYTVNIRNKGNDNNVFSYSKAVGEANATLDTFKIMADTGSYELILYVGDVNDNFTNRVIAFTVVE